MFSTYRSEYFDFDPFIYHILTYIFLVSQPHQDRRHQISPKMLLCQFRKNNTMMGIIFFNVIKNVTFMCQYFDHYRQTIKHSIIKKKFNFLFDTLKTFNRHQIQRVHPSFSAALCRVLYFQPWAALLQDSPHFYISAQKIWTQEDKLNQINFHKSDSQLQITWAKMRCTLKYFSYCATFWLLYVVKEPDITATQSQITLNSAVLICAQAHTCCHTLHLLINLNEVALFFCLLSQENHLSCVQGDQWALTWSAKSSWKWSQFQSRQAQCITL